MNHQDSKLVISKPKWRRWEREKKRGGDIPIATPGLTISMTIPIVLDVLLGEWGVLAVSQSRSSEGKRRICNQTEDEERVLGKERESDKEEGKTCQVTNTSLLPQLQYP